MLRAFAHADILAARGCLRGRVFIRELVTDIQEQLIRLACMPSEGSGSFDAPTVTGLRHASLLTDERYLWYRPTMAALRALKKIDAADGCGRQKMAEAPRCLHVNNEDFCR